MESVLIPGIQHIPHREAPEATLNAIADFCRRLLPEHEGTEPAAAR